MPDLEVVEVLTQAKDLIMEYGWGQNTVSARRGEGDNESYCLEEGICRKRGSYVVESLDPVVNRASQYVKKAIGNPHRLFYWNDFGLRTENEVFAALDDAILLAKEAATPGEES